MTPWTVARQAPLSMGFSRQEYWSELPWAPPGDLPNPGIEPMSLMSPAMAGGFFTTSSTWEAHWYWLHFPNNLVQFSSVQSLSRVRLCDPMNRSTPGLPVRHQLPEFTQTHIHRVSDAIQLSSYSESPILIQFCNWKSSKCDAVSGKHIARFCCGSEECQKILWILLRTRLLLFPSLSVLYILCPV